MMGNYFRYLLVACLFFTATAWASDAALDVVTISKQYDMQKESVFEKLPILNVRVEIEDPGHLLEYYTEILPVGSSTADALAVHHRITRGQICLDPDGVVAVDGVGDYSRGDYWAVAVNGDYVNSNAHTQLRSGDNVKWQHLKTSSNEKR